MESHSNGQTNPRRSSRRRTVLQADKFSVNEGTKEGVGENLGSEDQGLSCIPCNKTYSRLDSLRAHQRAYHGEDIIQCLKCSKRFSSQQVLRRHMVTHSQVRKYECRICARTFNRLDVLKSHEEIHSKVEIHCEVDFCKRVFHSNQAYRRHKRSHINVNPAENVAMERPQCWKCEKYATPHQIIVDPGRKRQPAETDSNKPKPVRIHTAKVKEKKELHQCLHCLKTFKFCFEFWAHDDSKIHLTKAGDYRPEHKRAGFHCDICARILSSKQAVEVHKETAHQH